ncbi:PDR/VanB family oxidoreductase [Amycolatopsis magusensis]|uniref:Ferredoxin-NADP reductase n=1 Tax=Amycolatopsis magusensis TaxID=882444 RepID=A0ABS4Q2G6_9PSEU|nr:2Fe-2S iron-sulfur cluster-binding protein [Amycolatopsis magusensis]MBP2185865.1 ferredoxin-NADP reductase [Amycolatopsis magusensis]
MTQPRFPPHLHGRARADRLLSTLSGVAVVYTRLSGLSGRRRPPVATVDRDLPMVVDEVKVVADGVKSLRLCRIDGAPLPSWRPGAHLDLVLPSGRVRQYSLCGFPEDPHSYRIAVRRIENGNGGSREIHEAIDSGTRLTARGPRNAFPFVSGDSYQFIAGGIGITPILPMVRAAAKAGVDWRLVYTGRDRASMPFLDELSTLDVSRVWIRPDTEYGIPASGAELLEQTPAGAHVYCCGPIPMITSVRTDLPASRARTVHFERFAEPPIVDGKPFRIELRRTGTTVDVPADRSALEAIRAVRPDVAYSCRQGFCGTCRVRVLNGPDPDMLICVGRGTGTIALDL